jgi:hypothetical protein
MAFVLERALSSDSVNLIQSLQLRRRLLRVIALSIVVCLVGCSTPTTNRQKAMRAAIISGGTAAAITLALGGDAGEAAAIGVGVAALAGGIVYVRNEMAISKANAERAEAELARVRAENSELAKKLNNPRGSRLAAFQVGDSKKIVVLDARSGKALERRAITTSGEATTVPVGFEVSSIPPAPGEEASVAYRTAEGDAEKSFGVVFMGKI